MVACLSMQSTGGSSACYFPHDVPRAQWGGCCAAGWHISHNAIKFDMNTFAAAVTALENSLAAGRPLAAWQVRWCQSTARSEGACWCAKSRARICRCAVAVSSVT